MKRMLGQTLLVLAVTFLLWLGLWAVLRIPVLPNPCAVVRHLALELPRGLALHGLWSLLRVLAATAAAVLLAVPLGLILGWFRRPAQVLTPFVYFSYPVPKLALLPILLVLFGLGEGSKLLMIFLIIFFPMVLEVSAAVRAVDRSLTDTLRGFGLSGSQILRGAVLPGLAAPILNCLKITTGMALSVLFFAENYGTDRGLGYYILNAWQRMDYVELYTGVTALALLGFLLFLALDAAERRVTRWK